MRALLKAAGALTLGFIGSAVSPAMASQQLVLETTCDGVIYTATTSEGRWSVVQSIDHDTHLITYAVEFAVSDAEGNVIFAESDAKGGKAQQNQSGQVTCSFTGELEGPEEAIFTISGIAHGVQRP